MEGDHKPTVQEILKDLKDRQQQVAQQLKDYPQTGSPEGFAVLFQENVELSTQIRKREKSISPEHHNCQCCNSPAVGTIITRLHL